jgi:methionine-rich copper-binding protein CopC
MRSFSCLLAFVAALGAATAAFAHAHLVTSSPAAGATVKVAPSELTLRFTEALEAAFCTVEVTDETGGRVEAGPPTLDPANPKVLHVTLAPLAKRKYKVVWKAVSVDSHTTSGNFAFTIAP